MADFAKLAVTAQRLITANGRTVTVRKHGSTPTDSAKPWRGQRTPVTTEVTGAGCFVPESMVENPDGVKRQGEYLLFAAADDDDNDLRTFDSIVDGGQVWKIVKATLLAPGSIRVIYEFEVER